MRQFCRLLTGCVFAVGLLSCSDSKRHSKVISQTRELTGFNQIFFTGYGHVEVSQGESESVRLEGEDSLLDLITTFVVDQALRIDYKRGSLPPDFFKSAVKVHIQVKDLQEIRLSGSGTVTAKTPLKAHQMKVSTSGSVSGSLEITGDKLVTIVSGSGNLMLKGKVESQDIWISGSGIYDGSKLLSKTAHINITGSGALGVHVEDDMEIRISGDGSIVYEGLPRIRQVILGSASVMRKGG